MFLLFLVFRLLRTRQEWPRGALQDAAAAFVCSFLPLPLTIPIRLVALLDALLWKLGSTRFAPAHLVHFRYAADFRSSFPARTLFPECALFLASFFLPPLLDRLCFWGLLAFLFPPSTSRAVPHVAWIWARDLFARKPTSTTISSHTWNETYLPIDPAYPLLRHTTRFLGPPAFEWKTPSPNAPHVLFLFLESFRAKDVGVHSPCFDALAQEGVLFTQFHAQGTGTSRGAIASLYSVIPPMVSSYLHYFLKIPLIGVPTILSEAGYTTGLIQGGALGLYETDQFFRSHGFTHLFGKKELQELYPGAPSSSWGIADEFTFQYAADWLAQQQEPTFLSLFTITNHHPWKLSSPPCQGFQDTFRYTDRCLGQFIDALKQKGLLERSILFILADHGQECGERGGKHMLNRHLYQESVQVPLLIYAPGRATASRIDEPASQIDLLPTLLDLLSLPATHHSMGRSLLRQGSAPIVMNHPMDDPLLALRKGSKKYILHAKSGKEEMYDLATDPGERVPLSLEGSAVWKEELLKITHECDALFREKKLGPPRPLQLPAWHLSCKDDLRLNDRVLLQKMTPQLRSLNLTGCLLLTEEGVRAALEAAPALELLALNRLDEVWGALPLGLPSQLMQLDWCDAPGLHGALAAPWIRSLKDLKALHLDASSWTDADYQTLGESTASWSALRLDEARHLDDAAFSALLAKQRELQALELSRAAITSAAPLQGQSIFHLVLEDCDSLCADEWLELFRSLPLQWLEVRRCPGLDEKALAPLRSAGRLVNGR